MNVRIPLTPPSRAASRSAEGVRVTAGPYPGGPLPEASGDRGGALWKRGEGGFEVGLGELRVLEGAGEVGVVGGQVEVAVAAEAEQDRALLARLLGGLGLFDRPADRVRGLG